MKQVQKILAAGSILVIAGVVTGSFPSSASAAADGKAVFDKHCSVCHSITPPPKSAPPILPVAARYHQRFSSRSEGIRQMAEFIKSPSKEKMLADEQAVTRFGLMPPIPLSSAELNAVAAWVWDQNTGGNWGTGRGAGKGGCNRQR